MILFDLGIKLYKDKFRPQMDRHPRHCHSRSSTVDIILKVLSRKLSIVLSGWIVLGWGTELGE